MVLSISLALLLGPGFVLSQDHLEPRGTPYPGSEQYWADVKQVFAAAYAPNVILRFFKDPTLGIENTAAGIRETHGVYEAFIITSSTRVWDLEEARQIKAGKIEGVRPDGSLADGSPYSPYFRVVKETPASAAGVKTKTETAPISPRLAQRIAKVWQKALVEARPPTKQREGFDGEVFSFSAPVQNRGVIDADIWSPERGSKTDRLVQLGEVLSKFAKKEIGEHELDEACKNVDPSIFDRLQETFDRVK